MEASVVKLAMEFTDEVRCLEGELEYAKSIVALRDVVLEDLRKELATTKILYPGGKDAEIMRLKGVETAYDVLCLDRDRAWALLAGISCIGETWTKGLCDEVEQLRREVQTLEAIKRVWYPNWAKTADWGHPIVP